MKPVRITADALEPKEQIPGLKGGPLAAVLGDEFAALKQREAALQASEKHADSGGLRDVRERMADLMDGIAAVKS